MQEYKVTVENDGTTRWFNLEGQLHREDGAAVEWEDGYKAWYKNGELHREDGPAVERSDGSKVWWLNDVRYTEEEWKRKVGKHTITLDGKTVEVSTESYENLKKLFKGEKID